MRTVEISASGAPIAKGENKLRIMAPAAREMLRDSGAFSLRRTASARMIEVAGERRGTEAYPERRTRDWGSVAAKLLFIQRLASC